MAGSQLYDNWLQSTLVSKQQIIAIVQKRLDKGALLALARMLGLPEHYCKKWAKDCTENNIESIVSQVLGIFWLKKPDLVLFKETLITSLELVRPFGCVDIVITLLFSDVLLNVEEVRRVINRNKDYMLGLAQSVKDSGRIYDLYLNLSLPLMIDLFNSSLRAAAVCTRYLTDFRKGIFYDNALQDITESLRYLFSPVLLPLPGDDLPDDDLPEDISLPHSAASQEMSLPDLHYILLCYVFADRSVEECLYVDSLSGVEYSHLKEEVRGYAGLNVRCSDLSVHEMKQTTQSDPDNCGVYTFISAVAILHGVTDKIKDLDNMDIVQDARKFMFHLFQHEINFPRNQWHEIDLQQKKEMIVDDEKRKYTKNLEQLKSEGLQLVHKIRESIFAQARVEELTEVVELRIPDEASQGSVSGSAVRASADEKDKDQWMCDIKDLLEKRQLRDNLNCLLNQLLPLVSHLLGLKSMKMKSRFSKEIIPTFKIMAGATTTTSVAKGKLISVIGDEDTCVGFLFGGVGEVDKLKRPNFFVVGKATTTSEVEEAFKLFAARDDIAIILINQNIAEMIRHVLDMHNAPIPAILEIPSKDHPYNSAKDSILRRARVHSPQTKAGQNDRLNAAYTLSKDTGCVYTGMFSAEDFR